MTPEEKRIRDVAYTRQWRLANPERQKKTDRARYEATKADPEKYREHRQLNIDRKLRRYGASFELFDSLVQAQQGRCAICREPMMPACFDHDHARSIPRSLLCKECNVGLGVFCDSVDLMQRAIAYVEWHRAYGEV